MNNLGEIIIGQIFKYGQCVLNLRLEIMFRFKMSRIAMIAKFEYYRKISEQGFLKRLSGGRSAGSS